MVSAVILAGGKSSRMNYKNKAYLEWKGRCFIEYIADELSKVADEIFISQARRDKNFFPQYKIVYDRVESLGPIGGIEAALSLCQFEKLIVAACDMPKINAKLFEVLLREAEEYEAVIPVVGERVQPLAAVYDKKILPLVRKQIVEEKYCLSQLLEQLNVYYVGEEELRRKGLFGGEDLFSNINTRIDYEQIRREETRPGWK